MSPAKIKVLRQQHADLTGQARKLVDTATAADRDLTPAEKNQRDAIFGKLDRVAGDIRIEEAELDRERGGPANAFQYPTPISSTTMHDGPSRTRDDHGGLARGQSPQAMVDALFGPRQHDMAGFASATEYFSALVAGRHDPRLVASGQNETTGSLGGYLITPAIEAQIMRLVLEESIFAGRGLQLRAMTAPTQEFPAFSTETDGANGTYYGLKRQWLSETGTATVQTATLDLRELHAHKAAYLVKITNSLLQDAPGFERQLLNLIGGAVGHFQDVDILGGSGSGQPLGVLNAPATIVTAKEAAQVADTVVYQNVLNMWARLAPQSAASAIWLASPSCLPQLSTMTVVVGTGGSVIPALTESGGRYSLLGRELVITHKCKPVGDQGDLVLVDPTQILVGLRAGMVAARSEHVGFLTDEAYIRVVTRWDSQPTWKAAHSPGSGHPTVSPYVVLAARA